MASLRLVVLLVVGSILLSTAAGGVLGWALASSSAASSSVGPEGPAGSPGEKGDDGLPGSTGQAGAQGPAGAAGASGPGGPEGKAGAQGERGAAGANGAPGAQGSPGPSGAPGATGPQGAAGAAGAQGASAPAVSTTSASGQFSYPATGEFGGEYLPGSFGPGTYVVGYSFRIHTSIRSNTIRCQLVDSSGTKYVESGAQTIDPTDWSTFRETAAITLASSTTLRLTCNETTSGEILDFGNYEDQALFAITMPDN